MSVDSTIFTLGKQANTCSSGEGKEVTVLVSANVMVSSLISSKQILEEQDHMKTTL